jgi:DNA-binding beta-propeller fold protein YncE
MKTIISILFFLVVLRGANAQQRQYSFSKKIELTGDGKWDYLKMDEENDRLFVTHQDRVHIIDLKTDKAIGEITGLKGVHGVALARNLNKGFISDGTDNSITVFDYTTLKVLKTVSVPGQKADAIMYDAFFKQVFVFNNGSGNAVVINAVTDLVVGEIELGGAPEFAVSDGKGTVFNNNEDTNEVTAIDVRTLKVKNHFSLLPSEVATGLAIDMDNNRLFSGCRKNKTLVVLDGSSGKIIQTLPIGGGVDAVAYDKDSKLVMASNGEGNVTVIKQESADKYSILQTLITRPGCKTMAHSAATHTIYLSGADYEADGKTVKPGSFGVYVYSMK